MPSKKFFNRVFNLSTFFVSEIDTISGLNTSACLANNMKLSDYVDLDHPHQIKIREILEFFTNCKIYKNQKGIDGCSAPQYAFTIKGLSTAMINLIKQINNRDVYAKEVSLLFNSIKKFPQLIGSKEKYDTQLIIATKGQMFVKGGAEGILLFVHKKKENRWCN